MTPIASDKAGEPGKRYGRPEDRVQVYRENPHYIQYKGEPMFLFGCNQGWTFSLQYRDFDYRTEIERLHEAGGNLIRIAPFITHLADDPERHDEACDNLPWRRLGRDGDRYIYSLDLDRDGGNPHFWERLADLVHHAWERDIVISFELWDLYGPARGIGHPQGNRWGIHPFFPGNSPDLAGPNMFAVETDVKDITFCRTVTRGEYSRALHFQRQYVRKLLDVLGPYPNVIYCVTNETSGLKAWSDYWVKFVHDYFDERWDGAKVLAGEMPREYRFTQNFTIEDMLSDDAYDFADASQYCNGSAAKERREIQDAALTVDALRRYYQHMEQLGRVKPVTCMKIYNWDTPSVIWSRLFAGAATARYHRRIRGVPGWVAPSEETIARGLDPADLQLEYVRHVSAFLRKTRFEPWRMAPDHELIAACEGVDATAAMTAPGCSTVAALFCSMASVAGRRASLRLPEGRYQGFFYSPTYGEQLEVSVADASAGEREISLPDDVKFRAAILHLKRVE